MNVIDTFMEKKINAKNMKALENDLPSAHKKYPLIVNSDESRFSGFKTTKGRGELYSD